MATRVGVRSWSGYGSDDWFVFGLMGCRRSLQSPERLATGAGQCNVFLPENSLARLLLLFAFGTVSADASSRADIRRGGGRAERTGQGGTMDLASLRELARASTYRLALRAAR